MADEEIAALGLPVEYILDIVDHVFDTDDFECQLVTAPGGKHFTYFITLPDQRYILRIHPHTSYLAKNFQAISLLEGYGVAPRPIGMQKHRGIFYTFESYLPGKYFPYVEKEKKEKVLPAIAKALLTVRKCKVESYEKVMLNGKKWQNFFLKDVVNPHNRSLGLGGVFKEIGQVVESKVPQPQSLSIVHGSLDWTHLIFDKGNVYFTNYKKFHFGEVEFDLGTLFYQDSYGLDCLDLICKKTKLDKKKVLYYSIAYGVRELLESETKVSIDRHSTRLRNLFEEVKEHL